MEQLIKILSESNLADYKIVEKTTVSHQGFFIGQKLDQHRICDVKHTTLTIYIDKDNQRASASKEIFANETEEEIRKDIESLKFNASLAYNKHYQLVKDIQHSEEMKNCDLLASFKNVVSAVQMINDTESEKINSYEIFVNQNYYHVVNSQGVDVSYNTLDEMVEIVINSINDCHEVEVYQMIQCGADQTVENIAASIKKTFKSANDRSHAQKAKTMLDTRVLISGEDLRMFFRYFGEKSNTQMVYRGMSRVQIGDCCQNGEDCDKITMEAKRYLPFSSKNHPYSEDGLEIKDFTILKDGVYKNYNGDQRTAYYLGLNDISPVNNIVISGGSKTVDELKKDPYLEIVQFSSFDMDSMTGDFGGEFRLAYYFDGETTTALTSGSITCNMNDVLDHLHFSKETVQYNDAIVPEVIELKGVNVAGE